MEHLLLSCPEYTKPRRQMRRKFSRSGLIASPLSILGTYPSEMSVAQRKEALTGSGQFLELIRAVRDL